MTTIKDCRRHRTQPFLSGASRFTSSTGYRSITYLYAFLIAFILEESGTFQIFAPLFRRLRERTRNLLECFTAQITLPF